MQKTFTKKSTLSFPFFFLFCMILQFFCFSCKSAPKRVMVISSVYNSAFEEISSANGCILTGDLSTASSLLESAYTKAMSIDNYELLISASLSFISLNLSYAEPNFTEAEYYLAIAKEFVQYSSIRSRQEALIALNEVRIKTAQTETQQSDSNADFTSLISQLHENTPKIKGDSYYEAQFLAAEADVYKAKKDYQKADEFYVQAAQMYIKNRYLSEIGITWYKDAQVLSLAGKKSAALNALENAIYYDRSAENSSALAIDYYAKGIILTKENPTEQEKKDAEYAFRHSAAIYEAINQTENAQMCLEKAESIK